MRLPQIDLDDRGFQDLVSEARLRINRSCPEWTEQNVSDPGITLIELFAWMTEMVIYRLNRIPDKLHVALMELLGIELEPPTCAETDVRFMLSAPPTEPVTIPGRVTEVATPRGLHEEPVVFQTVDDVTIEPTQLAEYVIERGGDFANVGVGEGNAQPTGSNQLPFSSPPQVDDAMYLGFEQSQARRVMRIDVDCSEARGAGVDPENPPLIWEARTGPGDDDWSHARVLEDTTGGFNYGSGVVVLELPRSHELLSVGGQRAYWVRCRVSRVTQSGTDTEIYDHPPAIYAISAGVIGALVPSSHSVTVVKEQLGESDGTAGQSFELQHAPILPTEEDEGLEVQLPGSPDWIAWDRVETFAESHGTEDHYRLDLAGGLIELGPAIRTGDGGWRQYGTVPPKGAKLRVSRYRHGGGRRGNVAQGALTVLKTAIPGVTDVTNPMQASGGVDPETLASARERAAMEIRTRYRAVTRDDFEFLSGEASPRVARAICVEPEETVGVARIHIVPRLEPAERRLEFSELVPDEKLFEEVASYLDERRLIGTRVELLPARYRGVTVVVNLQANLRADPRRVEEDVARALYTYINPLVGGAMDGSGTGWEFGRALNQGELYGVIHAVDGVDFVKILRVYETDLETGKQEPEAAGSHLILEADEVVASGKHIVKAEHQDY